MMKGGMQVVTFQRQRERQAEELLLTPGEMAARCDWQQVRRMREEMPDDVCSTHAWYQNCDALDRELRAQYPMIGALETAVRAYGYERISTCSCTSFRYRERSETNQCHFLIFLQRFSDRSYKSL